MNDFDPAFPGMLNCKNVRFTDVDTLSTEQFLFDGYWKELINLYGVGLNYQVHRYDKERADNLYGEHSSQEYADPVQVLALVELQENAVSLSKYGFVTDDSITLYFHIQTYTDTFEPLGIYQEVNQKYIAPKAGDIFELYEFGKTRPLGLGGKKFIVTERTDQDVGFNINQLAGHYVWVVKAKRYDPSYEPNVDEEPESYQIFDDDYTGRIEDDVEVHRQPSEQKQYDYSIENETTQHVFDYVNTLTDTSMYGRYVKWYSINNMHKMFWFTSSGGDNNDSTSTANLKLKTQPSFLINDQYYECHLPTEYSESDRQHIFLPAVYKVQHIDIYNKITGEWQPIGGTYDYSLTQFDIIPTTIAIDGEQHAYNKYIYNGPLVGERAIRFYVSPQFGVLRDDVSITDLPWFATITDDNTFTKILQPVEIDENNNYFYHFIAAHDGDSYSQSIKIPSGWVLDHVEIFNKVDGSWATIGNSKQYSLEQFTSFTEVMQIDGEIFEYTTYKYIGPKAGERELKFYVKYPDMNFYTAPTSGLVTDPSTILKTPWYATVTKDGEYTDVYVSIDENQNYYCECKMAYETNDVLGNVVNRQSIRIPHNFELRYIEMWNSAFNKWDIIRGSEDCSRSTFIKEYCPVLNYTQYTHVGAKVGTRKLRFYVTMLFDKSNITSETIDADGLPWYATSESINVFTPQSNDQLVAGEYFECMMQPETSRFKQAIQIPATYDIKYVKMFNKYSNRWMFISSKEQSIADFDVTHINKYVEGKTLLYKQYTHTGSKTGERILRFYLQ